MKIISSKIPEHSLAHKYLLCNFCDVYKCSANTELKPDDIQVAIWTNQPKWLKKLMSVRNAIVRCFGLEAEKGEAQEIERCIREGKVYRMMSVVEKSENETLIVLRDKHLDAYISIYTVDAGSDIKDVYLITIVHFHNLLGYIYFYAILPFHKLVVKGMMKHTLK